MKLRKDLPNLHPVIRDAVVLCTQDKRTARQLCAAAGVSHNVFHHWLVRRNGATVAVVDAILGTIGYELAVVKKVR